jgi:hypothetical protein
MKQNLILAIALTLMLAAVIFGDLLAFHALQAL